MFGSALFSKGRHRVTELALIAEWVRRVQCGLMGHATVLHFERRRISLRCLHCGHETPGWAIEAHR